MTDEQLVKFKELSKKFTLSADDYVELTFLVLGIEYELPDDAFDVLANRDNSIAFKHLFLISNVIGIDASKIQQNDKWKPRDELLNLIKSSKEDKKGILGEYGRISQIINDDFSLSAAQIYQLRKAVEAKLPEDEIIKLYYSGKNPAQMEKTIEYNILVREAQKEKNSKESQDKKNKSGFCQLVKEHKIITGAIAFVVIAIIVIALFYIVVVRR